MRQKVPIATEKNWRGGNERDGKVREARGAESARRRGERGQGGRISEHQSDTDYKEIRLEGRRRELQRKKRTLELTR